MSSGKRAGSRKAPRGAPRPRLAPTLLAAGATLAVIAWGYLVWMAIDFGQAARGGNSLRWALLALAAVGAMACLFVALMLVVRLLRSLGITQPPNNATSSDSRSEGDVPPPPGGRRRA